MAFFDTLINWLGKFWNTFKSGLEWVLDGFILLLKFVVFTIADGLFTVIEGFFATLDLSALAFNYAAQWSSLPPQLVWMINGVGLPQCLTMLGGAYLLRMIINLIPAALTRV